MKTSNLKENKVSVLTAPRITEKASMLLESNVYAFEVTPNATKTEIKKAIKSMYKVNPLKVAIVQTPAKKVFVRGRKGTKQGGKKAYVTLKKGDKIEIA